MSTSKNPKFELHPFYSDKTQIKNHRLQDILIKFKFYDYLI